MLVQISGGSLTKHINVSGHEQRALLEATLAGARQTGDMRETAKALSHLAAFLYETREFPAAIALFKDELNIRDELADKEGLVNVLHNLGRCYSEQGETENSRIAYARALLLARETGNKRSEAQALSDLASVISRAGDVQTAISLYEQSLSTFTLLCDTEAQATVLSALGYLNLRHTNFLDALSKLKQADVLFRRVYKGKRNPKILIQLGVAHAALGAKHDALGLFREALELLENSGESELASTVLKRIDSLSAEAGTSSET
jgi:Flp pilus assembly protein TadD